MDVLRCCRCGIHSAFEIGGAGQYGLLRCPACGMTDYKLTWMEGDSRRKGHFAAYELARLAELADSIPDTANADDLFNSLSSRYNLSTDILIVLANMSLHPDAIEAPRSNRHRFKRIDGPAVDLAELKKQLQAALKQEQSPVCHTVDDPDRYEEQDSAERLQCEQLRAELEAAQTVCSELRDNLRQAQCELDKYKSMFD